MASLRDSYWDANFRWKCIFTAPFHVCYWLNLLITIEFIDIDSVYSRFNFILLDYFFFCRSHPLRWIHWSVHLLYRNGISFLFQVTNLVFFNCMHPNPNLMRRHRKWLFLTEFNSIQRHLFAIEKRCHQFHCASLSITLFIDAIRTDVYRLCFSISLTRFISGKPRNVSNAQIITTYYYYHFGANKFINEFCAKQYPRKLIQTTSAFVWCAMAWIWN